MGPITRATGLILTASSPGSLPSTSRCILQAESAAEHCASSQLTINRTCTLAYVNVYSEITPLCGRSGLARPPRSVSYFGLGGLLRSSKSHPRIRGDVAGRDATGTTKGEGGRWPNVTGSWDSVFVSSRLYPQRQMPACAAFEQPGSAWQSLHVFLHRSGRQQARSDLPCQRGCQYRQRATQPPP